jgi:hypothetical protein
MAVLAGVLIVVAVVAVCVAKKKTSPKKLKTVLMRLMCEREACGHIFGAKITVNREPPYECEKCEEESAYQVVVCNRCEAYVPKRKPRLEDNVCPYCGKGDALGLLRGRPLARPADAAE